jgi:hypothetical protein
VAFRTSWQAGVDAAMLLVCVVLIVICRKPVDSALAVVRTMAGSALAARVGSVARIVAGSATVDRAHAEMDDTASNGSLTTPWGSFETAAGLPETRSGYSCGLYLRPTAQTRPANTGLYRVARNNPSPPRVTSGRAVGFVPNPLEVN